MSESSVPGLQLHATWGSAILLPAPEPRCRPQGWAGGWAGGGDAAPGRSVRLQAPLCSPG